ncbi:MAG: RNA methyltransferase, partial [Spirochaetes bacterium]|nr:RNA methyltransferase [Spirochaetota bacterium]
RAMKNMGLSRLRLVAAEPQAAAEEELRSRAVHAVDIWENAQFFDSLSQAVADCSFVAGTTCRRGQRRKSSSMTPRALACRLREAAGTAAIVFGCERTGLENDELDLCNAASHIPSDSLFPSLNLSHAVQIYAYELFTALGGENGLQHVKGEWIPVNQSRSADMASDIADSLAAVGFYKQGGRQAQERFLHDLISRAGLTESEGVYLKGIFAKAARLGSREG